MRHQAERKAVMDTKAWIWGETQGRPINLGTDCRWSCKPKPCTQKKTWSLKAEHSTPTILEIREIKKNQQRRLRSWTDKKIEGT